MDLRLQTHSLGDDGVHGKGGVRKADRFTGIAEHLQEDLNQLIGAITNSQVFRCYVQSFSQSLLQRTAIGVWVSVQFGGFKNLLELFQYFGRQWKRVFIGVEFDFAVNILHMVGFQ